MWHLKTRLGTFWVAPVSDSGHQFFLGVGDQELGIYNDAEQAAQDVHNQSTGYLKWDIEVKVFAPRHITDWKEGEPQNWHC
jgi:hypothetical protein